jgi:hypothetical protein
MRAFRVMPESMQIYAESKAAHKRKISASIYVRIRTLLIPKQRGGQSQQRRENEEWFGSRVQRHDNPQHIDDGREAHGYFRAKAKGERGRNQRANTEREIDGRQRDETDVSVQCGHKVLRNQVGNKEEDKAAGEIDDLRVGVRYGGSSLHASVSK